VPNSCFRQRAQVIETTDVADPKFTHDVIRRQYLDRAIGSSPTDFRDMRAHSLTSSVFSPLPMAPFRAHGGFLFKVGVLDVRMHRYSEIRGRESG
jgi:hypothetical protein